MDNLQARNDCVGSTRRFLHLVAPGFQQALAVALLAAGDMQRGDVVRHFQTKVQSALGHAIPAVNGNDHHRWPRFARLQFHWLLDFARDEFVVTFDFPKQPDRSWPNNQNDPGALQKFCKHDNDQGNAGRNRPDHVDHKFCARSSALFALPMTDHSNL